MWSRGCQVWTVQARFFPLSDPLFKIVRFDYPGCLSGRSHLVDSLLSMKQER